MAVDWNRRRYTKEEFVSAWRASSSYSDVCFRLNLAYTSGVSRTLKSAALDLGLRREDMLPPRKSGYIGGSGQAPLTEYLKRGVPWVKFGRTIKRRLFLEGIFDERCYGCGLEEWLGVPIPITIDHIDGDPSNNLIENLIPLCWNCHSLTPTFGGKNSRLLRVRESVCECGIDKHLTSAHCISCSRRMRAEKVDAAYPETSDLVLGVEEMGYARYSRTLGISGNGLKKLIQRRGVDPLPHRNRYDHSDPLVKRVSVL